MAPVAGSCSQRISMDGKFLALNALLPENIPGYDIEKFPASNVLLPENIPGWLWKTSQLKCFCSYGEYCSCDKYDAVIGSTDAQGENI